MPKTTRKRVFPPHLPQLPVAICYATHDGRKKGGIRVGVTRYKWNEISCKCWNIWHTAQTPPKSSVPPCHIRRSWHAHKLCVIGGGSFPTWQITCSVFWATPTRNCEEIRFGEELSLSGTSKWKYSRKIV